MGELIFVAVISALLSGAVMTVILAPRTLKMGFKWARAQAKLEEVKKARNAWRDEALEASRSLEEMGGDCCGGEPCDGCIYCDAQSTRDRIAILDCALLAETGGDE